MTERDEQRVLQLLEDGYTVPEVTARTGVPWNQIMEIIEANDLLGEDDEL